MTNPAAESGWGESEESAFARIMAGTGCGRLEAIRACRRAGGDVGKALGRVYPSPSGRIARPETPGLLACFAERHRVRLRKDGCGDPIIPGKKHAADMPDRQEYRCHVYDHGDGWRLGVCLMFLTKAKWTYAKRKLLAAGLELRQDGDTEGTLLFDPENVVQAKLALGACGAKRVREATAAQLLNLERARTATRIARTPAQEGTFALKTHDAAEAGPQPVQVET